MEFIDLKTQYSLHKAAIDSRVLNVLAHGQFIMGPEVAALESSLARYTGARHCVAASSGTDTLLIALMALGIGPGDEVITSPFSFFATVEVILLLGAKPVFVDISPDTYTIDVGKLAKAIGPQTKAIIPVSLYGLSCDWDEINAVAESAGIPVIEDAAQSFGSIYRDKQSCNLSTVGSTSFFPSKPLGCYGDGGALFTNDDELAKVFREIRIHGQERRYLHSRVGLNGRLDTIQAAILLEKLEIFPAEVTARTRIAERYTKQLSGALKLQWIPSECRSVFAQYTIEVEDRDRFIAHMSKFNIPTAVHYPIPLHLQPALNDSGYKKGDFPVAERAASRVVSLPMSPYLSVQDQEKVIATVLDGI